MDIEPTFKGYIEDENDALLILQATLDGKLKHIPRRPYEIERPYLIISGNIFVFIEEISGIKRWTDGVSWSPSRIANKFLIYKEIDKDSPSSIARRKASSRIKLPPLVKTSINQDSTNTDNNNSNTRSNPNSPTSSLRSVHPLKYTGLVKKTISVSLKRPPYNYYENFHIISYYTTEDVKQNRLITPKDSLFFRNVRPSMELITAMENTTLGNTKGHHKTESLTPSSTPMGNMEMVNINTAGSNPNHMIPYSHQNIETISMGNNNNSNNGSNNSNNNNSANHKIGQNGRNPLVKNEDFQSTSSTLLHSANPYAPQSPNPQNRYYVQQGAIPNGNGQMMGSGYGYQNSTTYSDYAGSQQQQQQQQQQHHQQQQGPPQQGQQGQQPQGQQYQSQAHAQKSQQGQPNGQSQGNVQAVSSYPYYVSSTPFNNQGYSESTTGNSNSGAVPSSYYSQNEQGTSSTPGIPSANSVGNLSSITYNAGPYPVYPVNVNMSYYGGNSAFGKNGPSATAGPTEAGNPSVIPSPMNINGKSNGTVPNVAMNNGYGSMHLQQGQIHSQQNHALGQPQPQQSQQPQQPQSLPQHQQLPPQPPQQYVQSQQMPYAANNGNQSGYASTPHGQAVPAMYQYPAQSLPQYQHQVPGTGPNVTYMYSNMPYTTSNIANAPSNESVNSTNNGTNSHVMSSTMNHNGTGASNGLDGNPNNNGHPSTNLNQGQR
ncbi:hypothetical protein C6P45_005076 [Maudiozyma exigua]|uniref:Uncharacterized protein n=1 Tax=Maudiozyma exigua TaxID=34358 RepID=A0A9P6W9W7_MAUEX|nr:hypothetical protein C6P45_005076 [Kazachstania exigua]